MGEVYQVHIIDHIAVLDGFSQTGGTQWIEPLTWNVTDIEVAAPKREAGAME